jgi:hypothetical protein
LVELASCFQELDKVMQDECSALLKCKELLIAFTALENQERSLRIQHIQSHKSKIK